ncbi:uncharacterized protein [Rutidosis leptorrhynchoides]|uniref:uncharacterized protein n=1 Tax=Rutidosis leptorrhynchoides TaxID=125765 RepID=UPI003A98DD6B
MILFSLLLQIILVVLGHRLRSRSSAKGTIVWLTYLSADLVATTSLGLLMRSDKETFTELAAFWAPFLLLHLGGPDTITAYSLEDNQLWGRRLLDLGYQVTVTAYVFFKFRGSAITYLAIPMFVAAIIKYGERIWRLRSANDSKLTESLYHCNTVSKLDFLSFDDTASTLKDHATSVCRNFQARYIHISFTIIQFFKPLFMDLNIRLPEDFVLKRGFSSASEFCSSTLKLVDTELGFLYDEIYTKRPLLNTLAGVTLRGVSLLCSFSGLIAFSGLVAVDTTRKQYSTHDIWISFVLLIGAVLLEIYSIIAHCLSDWALLWATKSENFLSTLICKANAPKLTWNRGNVQASSMVKIPQYNFINSWVTFRQISFFKYKSNVGYVTKWWSSCWRSVPSLVLKDNLLMTWWCTTWKKIEWEKRIQTQLDKQFKYRQSGDVLQHKHDMEDFNLWKLFENRLRGESDEGIKEAMKRSVGIGDCIIILHLATDICYHVDAELHNFNNCDDYTTSKLLSDYMMYILMSESSMLVDKGNHEFLFSEISFNLYAMFRLSGQEIKIDNARTLSGKLLEYSCLHEYEGLRLPDIVKLARWLQQEWRVEDRWGLISEVWVETLVHVAMQCPGKEHLKCLGRGGDLVTSVSLLMMHYGLGSRIHLVPKDRMKLLSEHFYGWVMQIGHLSVLKSLLLSMAKKHVTHSFATRSFGRT